MNEQRDKTTVDRQVSDTYREVANEVAPHALNDKVLRMAASTKPRWSPFPGAWMKPVAWAATIGLSLVIVMEMTQVPQPTTDVFDDSPSVATDLPGAGVLAPDGLSAEGETDDPNGRQQQAGRAAVTQPTRALESLDTVRERRGFKPDLHRAEMPVTEEAAAASMKLAPERQEAAMRADSPAGEDADVSKNGAASDATAVTSMAMQAEQTRMAEPVLCPAGDRESAEKWYQCIAAKRATSPPEAIHNEIEALRKRFPDYPIPDRDK